MNHTHTYCRSASDRFVMSAWNRSMASECRITNTNVKMLSDGDAALSTALGFREDMGFGFGVRSKRFALAMTNGVVDYVSTDPGMDVCDATSASSLLAFLDPPKDTPGSDDDNSSLVLLIAAAAAVAFFAASPDLLSGLVDN